MSVVSGDESGCVNFMSYLIQKSSAMLHPDIRALEAYWQDLRAGRVCPFRAEVDPRDIPSKIGSLFILEDLGLGNVRFRIAGTALIDAFGLELRGMPVGSVMEFSARQSLTELLRETMAEPGVGYARLRRADAPGETWELLLLPLRSDHGRVDRLIGALHRLGEDADAATGVPLRFTIESMSIAPVEITEAEHETPVMGLAGFADSAIAFTAALPSQPRTSPAATAARPGLIAISGGRAGTDGDDPKGPGATPARTRLRLVSDH
ncbi:MAG: PAS domain-containing protein [Thermohalobaculum sp.]|nr:PAS domain-containing protein [Thermohalobaculum sp.]